MPDILIRGMEMPDSCEFCRFHGYGGYEFERVVCSLTGRSKEKPIFSRFDDCPLVELPPHGDLIDRDALEDTGADVYVIYDDNGVDESYAFSHDAILNAPVIVPANKEDANG